MAALSPQTRLGPYEILAPLGAGGMGEVYKARDTRLDRMVAIKVLTEHLSTDPDLRARFEREARAVSSLNHPNICTLFDVGHQEGIDYLVMEYLEGETLAQRLERGPLPVPELLRFAGEIADALDKAHRQGMIHRDLKPGNVMLTKAGAKLLDFGLARAAAPSQGGSGIAGAALSRTPTMSTPLTAAGMIVGTFQYMAPEQLEGGEADARSDIWAFGATVYEMATAKKAFEGPSQASLIASVLKEEPRPLSDLQPLAPPGLDRLVSRCLAKDPDNRWQSARDLAHELRWIAEAGSKAGVPAPVAARRRSRERMMMIAAGASTLGMIAFAIGFVMRAPKKPETVRFEILPPTTVQFQDAPRVSPDGRNLAYSASDSTGTLRLWVRPLAAASANPLPGTDGITQRPFWSPDSRYIGFFAGGKLKKVQVGGGPAAAICDAPNGSDGSWGRGGVILYDGGTNDPIRRVAASGGIPTAEVVGDSAHNEQVGWPFFLPDGKRFLYMTLGAEAKLVVGELGSKKRREIGPIDSRAEYVPPGYLLFVRSGSLVAQPFDAGSARLRGEPFPVVEPVRTAPNGGADFSASETGTLTYASGQSQSSRLLWMDRGGKDLNTVTTGDLSGVLNVALSPDGRRVAFRTQDPQSRTRDLWVADLTRGVATRLTFDPGNENHATWSPDGSRIAYWSDDAGAAGLWVRSAGGAGEPEQLLKSTDETVVTDWSRDGRFIVYTLFTTSRPPEIRYLPLEGDRKPVTFLHGPFPFLQGMLSPDGHWLAYTSEESGKPEIYVQPFPQGGGKWQISSGGGNDPHWRGDGKELYYLSPDQKMMSVALRPAPTFEADVPKPLFQPLVLFPGTSVRTHYAVTPDAQRFLISTSAGREAVTGTQVVLNWNAEVTRK